ncbi:MAG: class I SAM-dependent methyltransferase [Achromobacter pulmonis]|uniref:Ubiquinone biosynthesis O-methyltransferase, mitochondrial n=1 Tax=Achromobacter pulmonis TaxID=1389932 RepID=A0A6S7DEM9_9BURK|nr:class I SAM-dependent methyltransferase [Achromobacter pulmonis]CAB3650426.1 Ubiquinone biosynthesis O-methyltransferase, mitochondrial [Achromobacter pulmonis]CAB3872677.1 Ubiquinone biosynthesis O-methyltransferase, mitochondrial [Achromobacter pulmonis]
MAGSRTQGFETRAVRAIRRRLYRIRDRIMGPDPRVAAVVQDKVHALEERLVEQLTYLQNEISEARQYLRFLLGESDRYHQWMNQTRASFNTQWDMLPEGAHLVTDEAFVANSGKLIETYTQLPASWFKGKSILDAGCGNGRWAYALSRLGANVMAVDQSEHGLRNVRRLCEEFPGFRHRAVNLLEPLPFNDQFDLVWSYGVLHHTGDTKRAFDNILPAVKADGSMFLMLYGEPCRTGEYAEINTYVQHRRATAAMTFAEKVQYLKSIYPAELVHGYFDAISPAINDLYRYDEILDWLNLSGFSRVSRTLDSRNLHIMAHRNGG